MAEPGYVLSGEIRKVLQRELGQFGLTVFTTQCSELNIRPEELKSSDLLRLSQAVIRAVRPSAGDDKALRVGKEIQKFKVKAELGALKGKDHDLGSQRRLAELHVSHGNLCLATGDYNEGVRTFKTAVRVAKNSDHKLKEAEAYIGIGLI